MELDKFYNTFFSSDPKNITTLDMQNTFKVKFEFEPKEEQKDNKDGGNKFTNALKSAAKSAVKSLLQNASGGLLGGDKAKDVMNLRKKFEGNKKSILHYITEGTMIGDGGSSIDMTMFVQSITLPNMQLLGTEEIYTQFGTFSTSGFVVDTDQHEIRLDILNTNLPIMESIMHPWMREVTMPYWVYQNQPYTTAKITVDLTEHVQLKYVFYGCFPCWIQTYQPSMQLNSQFTRQVSFKFQYMMVKSDLKSKEKVSDKLRQLGNSLLNGASKMI